MVSLRWSQIELDHPQSKSVYDPVWSRPKFRRPREPANSFCPVISAWPTTGEQNGVFPKVISWCGLHSSQARGWQAFLFNSSASLVFVKATFSSYWILIEGDSPQQCRYLATELCLIIHSIHIIVLIMMEMATPLVALMRRKKYADLPTGKFSFHFSLLCYIMIFLRF